MNKVFMSFLGTNPYLECIFKIDGKRLPPSRFVQEATTRHYCEGWNDTDRIVIFTTRLSYEKNWCDNGHGDGHCCTAADTLKAAEQNHCQNGTGMSA